MLNSCLERETLSGEKTLQWVSENNRILLRLNGSRVEIIEGEGI